MCFFQKLESPTLEIKKVSRMSFPMNDLSEKHRKQFVIFNS